MALYTFDGTGNEDDPNDNKDDSNALLFFDAYDDPAKNNTPGNPTGSLYLKGIGARAKTFIGKAVAEAFGLGGHERIKEAMGRLERNVAAGDPVIDVAGFSRGAALSISFANEIAKKHPEMEIRFIGVFDIVGEFGAPGKHFNAGHNLNFPPNAKICYHAMALDEHRAVFQLTRLADSVPADKTDRLIEVWFRGVHSDVGGGNGNHTLNWIALNWLYQMALKQGLPIPDAAILTNLARKSGDPQIDHKFEAGPMRKVRPTDLVHASVQTVDDGKLGFRHNNPPAELARVDDNGTVIGGAASSAAAVGE